MLDLICAARRVGDQDGRTEEYELRFSVGDAASETVRVKYQAARAYEINAALDAATAAARRALASAAPQTPQPTDEALAKFSWRTLQSAKYERGETRTGRLGLP